MFLFDKNPLADLLGPLFGGPARPAAGAAPASPAPAAAPGPAPAPASPSPEALGARSELGSPFVDAGAGPLAGLFGGASASGEQTGGGFGGLLQKAGELFFGGLFGGGQRQPDGPPSGWALAGHEGEGRDVTGDYKDLVGRAQAGENTLPEDAAKYVYLNVPGFFGDHLPTYLDANVERMKALGLDERNVPIDTEGGVEQNASTIRDMVDKIAAEEHRQVVLSGQSKGGVDISAAMALYPELAEHVRAVVSMQAPYGGTPLADGIEKNPVLQSVVNETLSGIGGDGRAIGDLTYDARQKFVGEHPYPAADVPTVSLATSSTSPTSIVGGTGAWMRGALGLENDGFVPTRDEIIPGSDVVKLDNMDHAGSNLRVPGRGNTDDPADVQQALLTLALRKAQEKEDAAKAGPGH